MKRLLLLLMLITFGAQPALAQTWEGPGPQTVAYTNAHTVGDGTDAQGGVAPAYSLEPSDVASGFTESDWYTTNDSGDVVYQPTGEVKFRTHCNVNKIGLFDPLLFPGQANKGHLHMFFGNTGTNPSSDYTSLRNSGKGTCGGGPMNRTAYWFPATQMILPTGYVGVMPPDDVTVYYAGNTVDAPKLTRIPRNFKYIGGFNPSDGNKRIFNEVAAANTAAAARGEGSARYVVPATVSGVGSGQGSGFEGWSCATRDGNTLINGSNADSPVAGSMHQPYLKNPNGTLTLTCPVPGKIVAEIFAPDCWDGKNLGSPDMRSHVRYRISDTTLGLQVCPDGWYQLPSFFGKFWFDINDPAEVGKIFLSSDVMDYGAPDATSRSPCRQVSNHYCNGETFHFDWFGAWSYGTGTSLGAMLLWQNHCLGIRIRLDGQDIAGDPHACQNTSVNVGVRIKGGILSEASPSGYGTTLSNNPVIEYHTYGDGGPTTRFWPVPPGSTGDAVMRHGNHHVSMNDNDPPLTGVLPLDFDLKKAVGQ